MKRENLTKGMIQRAAMMLLLCVLTMTVQTAWAQEHSGTTDDGLTWELTQDGNGDYTVLTITGTGNMKNYGHTTVDNIWKTNAPWGYDITRVTIGDGVTSIGDYAFIGCVNLASVTIGSGVSSIGIGAINHCDQMTTITLPASVTTIAYAAFENCQALQTVYIQHDGAVSLTGDHDNQFNAPNLQYIFFPSASAADANSEGNWARYADNKRVTIYSTSSSWAGDYLVTANVTISSRISVTANTTLTIADGVTLTASKGIAIEDENATLTVDGNGTLIANGTKGGNGVSGHSDGYGGVAGIDGNLIVNGGTVNATGGNGGTPSTSKSNAGLGGAGINGSLTVIGGIVTVSGGSGGTGGAGHYGSSDDIRTGGTGGLGGAGINGSLTVNGGIVTVSGGSGGAGGAGYKETTSHKGGNGGNGGNGGAGISDALTVNGGTVNTYGGSGGHYGKRGRVHGGDGEYGSAGRGLGGTVTSSSATAYIQESYNKITWSNMTSNESTKRYVRVIEPINVTLADNASNTDAITENNGQFANVTLSGRTLWKDGAWNTLCLPFDVIVGSGQMAGATAMTLNGSTSGFDSTSGVLTLNFDGVGEGSTIPAGTPFIVKWTGEDVTSPVFSGVTISTANNDIAFTGGTFKGSYSYMEWAAGTEYKSILLLGANSKLFWPNGENVSRLGACRAYFELSDGVNARAFVLNFNGDATGVRLIDNGKLKIENEAGAWYTLDGRKLDAQPTKAGVYIHGGRKVVVK